MKQLKEIDKMIFRLKQAIEDLEELKTLPPNFLGNDYPDKLKARVTRDFLDIKSRSKEFIDCIYGRNR